MIVRTSVWPSVALCALCVFTLAPKQSAWSQILFKSSSVRTPVALESARVKKLREEVARLNVEILRLRARNMITIERELKSRLVFGPSVPTKRESIPRQSHPEDIDRVAGARALERALVREGGALLPEGTIEVTTAFGAKLWDRARPVTNRNTETASAMVSFGITRGMLLSASLPWERSRTASGIATGFGDLTIAVSRQLLEETATNPNAVLSVGLGLDLDGTGAKVITPGKRRVSSVFGSLSFTKRFDPVVLFATAFTTRESSFGCCAVAEPARVAAGVRWGAMLALSPSMSMTGAFSFWRPSIFNSGTSIGVNQDISGEFSLALNMILTPRLMVNVAASSRLLGPGPDFSLSISLPYRF